jgi:hypothetical protein
MPNQSNVGVENMARSKVTATKRNTAIDLNEEGATALMAATFTFLHQNNISKKSMLDFAQKYCNHGARSRSLRIYRQLEKAQEDMGTVLATWFSHPKFLDPSGNPLPLSSGKGPQSIAQLVRVSGTGIELSVATDLMRQSRSVKLNSDGYMVALRRAFVLPKLEILRAAFVVERYLDTLTEIASNRKKETPLVLERSSHVSEMDLSKVIPMLRDIEIRGTAFMDSIDGDLEGRRLRNSRSQKIGELGVHVFAWTRPAKRNPKLAKPRRAGRASRKP